MELSRECHLLKRDQHAVVLDSRRPCRARHAVRKDLAIVSLATLLAPCMPHAWVTSRCSERLGRRHGTWRSAQVWRRAAGDDAGEGLSGEDKEAARKLLERSLQLGSVPSSSEEGRWARSIEPSSVGPGSVLLANPGRFAAASSRAGAGSAGVLEGPASWLLQAAAFLGLAGLDIVADSPRFKRSSWMPVVLVTAQEADGSTKGLALTARTGVLLGDFEAEGASAFATRPLGWGGPEDSSLSLLHPYSEVPKAQALGDSGLHLSRSLPEAKAWLDESTGSSLRFRFFSQCVRWGGGELERELQDGTWLPLSASCEAVLDEAQGLGGQPLWAELAAMAGGEAAELAKSYDLLG